MLSNAMLSRLRLVRRSFAPAGEIPAVYSLLRSNLCFINGNQSSGLLNPSPPLSARVSLRLRRRRAVKLSRALCTGEGTNPFRDRYLSVSIRCNKDDAIELSEALLCFGASSASMDELSSSDEEICITSIFTDDQNVEECISSATASIAMKYLPSYKVSVGEQCDWVTKVQMNFRPIEVTSGLWIIPKWSKPPDSQAKNVILDPGLAFGSGEHPTTKLCLMLLYSLIKGGEHFFDYGIGSGVLGIAAVKMGAVLSVGIDIEPQAVMSAQTNIALNNIDPDRMLVYLVPSKCDLVSLDKKTTKVQECHVLHDAEMQHQKGSFDIVIANILLNPLLELAEDIVGYAKPGAVVGLSGILSEQVPGIMDCYSEHLETMSVTEMDGWACLSGTKKTD